ncbi:hypothetical protein ABT297_42660 [Dactylosporangium sp. NPDC000555]|uniref:hypothetical protein n=1 Tax=Dactylosporangium sp. NPDC000555 TaxID=3154260 RepID=UPI0033204F38
MRNRIVSLLSVAAIAAAATLIPAAPALAQGKSCRPVDISGSGISCDLTLGSSSTHVMHLATTDLYQVTNVVTIQDNVTKVYVYNNDHAYKTGDTDVWIPGLYGNSYTATLKCWQSCPRTATLNFAN